MIQKSFRSFLASNHFKISGFATMSVSTFSTRSSQLFKTRINHRGAWMFSSDNKYRQKTTKEIEKQIGMQKWKQMQNTFKSLNSRFSLTKPSPSELEKTKYPKPTKLQYNLENLRQYSHSFPVYLYWELEKDDSPMNQVISKVIDNLWKAEQKETLQFLQFLYAWQYKKVDLLNLYEVVISKFDLSMGQLFKFMKKFDGKLFTVIEMKVLERLNKENLSSNQYGDLLRIVNFFTVKNLLSDQFYLAITNMVSSNINQIPPGEALQAYVYYTYNINQHLDLLRKQGQQEKDSKDDLGLNIVKVIENRILAPECLKFYNGEQLVALLHTFLKNNLILEDQSKSESYQAKIDKIINRVQLAYYAQDFSSKNKQSLLQICGMLPEIKKQTIIALIQNQFFKKTDKFDYNIVPNLYLISYQNNMLTEQLQTKLQEKIIENIFLLDKKDISRVLWLMTLNRAKNLQSMHKKIQTIIEGGLNQFRIQDISIIVWSMCANDFGQEEKFWDNIQSFLFEELQRQVLKIQNSLMKKVQKQGNEGESQVVESGRIVNQCSWILWAYHNNRPLGLQLVDLITSIIISEFETQKVDISQTMKPFELTSIISFYYSLDFPEKSILERIKKICLIQFNKIYSTMEPIELCKCLKYIGQQAWRDKKLAEGILDIFQVEAEKIPYRDIITVVGIVISSQIKTKRVTALITKLMERKKRLESLEGIGSQPVPVEEEKPKQKKTKWRFTL